MAKKVIISTWDNGSHTCNHDNVCIKGTIGCQHTHSEQHGKKTRCVGSNKIDCKIFREGIPEPRKSWRPPRD